MFYFVGNVVTRAGGQGTAVKYAEAIGLLAVTVLLTFQCFRTIDTMMRLCFKRLDAISTDIYHIGHINDDSNIYYGDEMIYNT